MKQNFSELVEAVKKYEQEHLSEKRYQHCLRVADMSCRMAKIYGADEEKAYFAGLSHDICKWMDKDVLVDFCKDDGYGLTSVIFNHPSLLHGRAGAIVLRKEFGVVDEDVLEAVARHVSGSGNLSVLGRIVYSADKIEPGRKWVTEEYLNTVLSKPLNEMALQVASEINGYITESGGTLEAESVDYIKFLESKVKESK